MKIHYHFLMDPRRGGPHQFVDNFKNFTKKKIKNKIIINGKKSEINLSFFKHRRKILYLFEIFINILKLYFFFKKKKHSDYIELNVHGFYNFAPLIFLFFSNYKFNWFIHEEISKKFFFIFKYFSKNNNIYFLYDFRLIGLKKKDNFFIIKPSVDINFWKLKNKITNKKTFSFLTIGNLNPLKNHKLLLNSISQLKFKIKLSIAGEKLSSHKNYYFDIINYKETIEKNSNSLILLLGKLNKKKIKENLSISDFFIMTSKSEGTPFALLEAMSCHKICIIPNINTLRNIFKNNQNGFYFKDNNVKSLNAVITKVLNLNIKNKLKIAAKARNLISKKFSHEIFKKNISKHFLEK